MRVHSVTHRKKASVSTPGKAASSAIAKHDLCLRLTEKAEQRVIALSHILLDFFSASWSDFQIRTPKAVIFLAALHGGQTRKLASSCLISSRRCQCF